MNSELKFKYGYRRLKREKAELIKKIDELLGKIEYLEENT